MHSLFIRRIDATERALNHIDNNPVTPALESLTTLTLEARANLAEMLGHADDQESGRGQFQGATEIRQEAAEALLKKMRPISKIARSLNRTLYPEARAVFKMPTSGGYRGIIARAQAFLDGIPPLKTLFVGRGLAADFDTQLTAAKGVLAAATDRKADGLQQQVGGTAGMQAKSRRAVAILHELDAIFSHRYENDPAKLAEWKSACRVERDPVRAKKPAPAAVAAPAS